MLEFAYNESAPNCLTGRVGERFWVNGPGTPDWAAVANIAGAQGYLPRRFLRLAPAPPPPPVPEPGPNRQRMALAVREGDRFTNAPLLDIKGIITSPLEISQFRYVYDQTANIRNGSPAFKMQAIRQFMQENAIPEDILRDTQGNFLQTAEECAARLWTDEAANMLTQINSGILFDNTRGMSTFATVIRLLNMFIFANPPDREMTLYHGGSTVDPPLPPVHTIVRQPMYVSLTENVEEVQRSLPRGAPIIEFRVPARCANCGSIPARLTQFPNEAEWVLPPYTPIQYVGERIDRIGRVVTVKVLDGSTYFGKALSTQVFLHVDQ